LVYYFSDMPENTLPLCAAIILALGAFGGSFRAGKTAGSKGLYHGFAVGVVFFIAVWLISVLFFPGPGAITGLIKLSVILPGACAGGILGVGMAVS
jgi:putative membrane protein (TIGR04086 family)